MTVGRQQRYATRILTTGGVVRTIVQCIAIAALAAAIGLQTAFAQTGALASKPATPSAPESQQKPTDREVLTDAAIAVLLIATSIASYRAMGKPCACPNDRMRNGRRCGDNSAWSRPGGFKPLCYPSDITAGMIETYRAKKIVPSLK